MRLVVTPAGRLLAIGGAFMVGALLAKMGPSGLKLLRRKVLPH